LGGIGDENFIREAEVDTPSHTTRYLSSISLILGRGGEGARGENADSNTIPVSIGQGRAD